MGWDGIERAALDFDAKGKPMIKEFLDREYSWTDKDGVRHEVIKSAMRSSTYYAALKVGERVIGLVVLTQWRGADPFPLHFKSMTEDVEPYYYDCPPSILKLLTTTDNANALKWRSICEQRAAEKASEKKSKANAPTPHVEGVTVEKGRGSYIFRSARFHALTGYLGIKFAKRSFSLVAAYSSFMEQYGTDEQKAEWEKWKEANAVA